MKLRTIIFLSFFIIGLFPLFSSIGFNLPKVLFTLEQVLEDKRIAELQSRFQMLSYEVERGKEKLRLLTMVPGVKDLVVSNGESRSIASVLVRKRLGGMVKNWFDK
jgi:hypothetical protein